MISHLNFICEELLKKWDCQLLEFGGESDHIHLLISAHPSLQMSNLINNLKTVSSRLMRKEYSSHLAKFYWKPVLWTRAYCLLTTGGAPIETIRRYIENQGKK
jgi:putative transposase